MLDLEWVVATFLAGGLTMFLLMNRSGERPLRRRLAATKTYWGHTYADILRKTGRGPDEISRRADGCVLRTWREGGYAITLRFDAQDVCLGVEEERIM